MTPQSKGRAASARDYDVEAEWSEADLTVLNDLKRSEESLPMTAPRALLSIRLSVFTDDTTSPVRQELDLRILAREKGYRVVGKASDLNISATKVPPWERPELGDWLQNRAPEFDSLLFWKLDRFVRSMSDLAKMIAWCKKYDKNLVSKHDPIDLSTAVGKIMVTILGGVAEIEATNTSARVGSLWQYTKGQSEWTVGRPPYGYATAKDAEGKGTLAIKPDEAKALHVARTMLVTDDTLSLSAVVRYLKEKGMVTPGLTVATLTRRLSNPGTLGFRVEEDKAAAHYRRSKLVYGRDGNPIRVGPAIFTQEEWDSLQAALDKRKKKQPKRTGKTRFLGVLKCADCEANMGVHQSTNKHGVYAYLRCLGDCKSGGPGAPHPAEVFDAATELTLKTLGHRPVEFREYERGAEARKRKAELEERIGYYMKGLEPGGQFTKFEFTRNQAQDTLDALMEEMGTIDPAVLEDRWVRVEGGMTWREHWDKGGTEAMEQDLIRAGIKIKVIRTKVPGVRAPNVKLKIVLPPDYLDRLLVTGNDFGEDF